MQFQLSPCIGETVQVNMWSLESLGYLERTFLLRRPCFLLTYVMSGLVGSLFSFKMVPNPTLGSSGVVTSDPKSKFAFLGYFDLTLACFDAGSLESLLAVFVFQLL